MSRAARTVAKEMADWLEHVEGLGREASVEPGDSAKEPTYLRHMRRWIVTLCPPRKRKVVSKGTKARRATVRELDALCREVVFLRDGGKCRKCGRSDGLMDWAHVYSRRYRVTRWALENSMVLCRGCHMWWHQSPTEAVSWYFDSIGSKAHERLERLKRAAKCGPLDLIRLGLEMEKKELA